MLLLIERTADGPLIHTPAPQKVEDRTVTKTKAGKDECEVVTFAPRFETPAEAAVRAVKEFAVRGRALTIVDAPEFTSREQRDQWIAKNT